jgi:formylmethanofuran dehydrogenase subunit E
VKVPVIAATLALLAPASLHAQTPEEWIRLGTRIHGAFDVLVPIGIRIGLDAQQRLKAAPRGLTVTYFVGERSPCPCIADGIMLATQASPGQGTMHISLERAPAGAYAAVIIRDRKTGEGLRYTISDDWAPKVSEWNRSLDPAGRYAAAMNAENLFDVAASPFGHPARTPSRTR